LSTFTFKPGARFTHVSCGAVHTLAVAKESPTDGDVVAVCSFGCNDEGALGRRNDVTRRDDEESGDDDEEECFRPLHIDLGALLSPSPAFRVAKVSCGGSHSALLTTDGRVFVWGVFRVSRRSGRLFSTAQYGKKHVASFV
jgi:alpha-tubulin suppressor-like RCC1 family protein